MNYDEKDKNPVGRQLGNYEALSAGEIKLPPQPPKIERNHPASEQNREPWESHPKSEQLRRITNRLTEIFTGNQKKIERYE